MSAIGYVAVVAQVVVVVGGAPLLTGLMRQVRARLEGRAGAGVLQPWRDTRKLLHKEPITPIGTGPAFRTAPALLVATALVVAALVPLLSTETPLAGRGDLILVVALLALGTVALALAGLDTGTAFGGMGSSREMTIAALAEPTLHPRACIHCPMLQVNPKMLPRLAEIEKDLLLRRKRAQEGQWLGEVEGIDSTLTFLRAKQAEAARLTKRPLTDLGIPRPRPEETQ